jgi:hypothetical protein
MVLASENIWLLTCIVERQATLVAKDTVKELWVMLVTNNLSGVQSLLALEKNGCLLFVR